MAVWFENLYNFVQRGAAGDYPYGVSLFMSLAPRAMKARYGKFFTTSSPEVAMPMLKAKLRDIMTAARTDPRRFPQVIMGKPGKQPEDAGIESRMMDIEDAWDNTDGRMQDVEDRVEEAEQDIAGLKKEVIDLKKPGLHVTEIGALPPELQLAYRRIKALVPKMAHLHAELFTAREDAERKNMAAQLCALDEERRKLWDKLDEWQLAAGDRPEGPEKKAVALIRRKKQLRQNILSALKAVEMYGEKPGKEQALAAAQERLDRYRMELEAVEGMLKD